MTRRGDRPAAAGNSQSRYAMEPRHLRRHRRILARPRRAGAVSCQSADAVSAVTPRGGIALKPHPRIRPFASESITKTGWNQRIALCLPADDCAMNQPRRADGNRRRSSRRCATEDREAILFDLGLGALQADFCVRIGDRGSRRAAARARRPRRVRARQSRDGDDPRGQSASRLHQPARPHRGLSADPAAVGQEPGGAAHACAAEAAEEPAEPIPRPNRSRRAGFPARISIRRIRRATAWGSPAVRCHAPSCLSADDGRVAAIPQPLPSSGGWSMRCWPASRPSAIAERPPRPDQRPHCVAADEGRRDMRQRR